MKKQFFAKTFILLTFALALFCGCSNLDGAEEPKIPQGAGTETGTGGGKKKVKIVNGKITIDIGFGETLGNKSSLARSAAPAKFVDTNGTLVFAGAITESSSAPANSALVQAAYTYDNSTGKSSISLPFQVDSTSRTLTLHIYAFPNGTTSFTTASALLYGSSSITIGQNATSATIGETPIKMLSASSANGYVELKVKIPEEYYLASSDSNFILTRAAAATGGAIEYTIQTASGGIIAAAHQVDFYVQKKSGAAPNEVFTTVYSWSETLNVYPGILTDSWNTGVVEASTGARDITIAQIYSTYYVRGTGSTWFDVFGGSDGNDSTGNGSIAKPYKTLQAAIDKIVKINSGAFTVYVDGTIELSASATDSDVLADFTGLTGATIAILGYNSATGFRAENKISVNLTGYSGGEKILDGGAESLCGKFDIKLGSAEWEVGADGKVGEKASELTVAQACTRIAGLQSGDECTLYVRVENEAELAQLAAEAIYNLEDPVNSSISPGSVKIHLVMTENSKVKKIGKVADSLGQEYNVFEDCTALRTLTIPSSVKYIEKSSFKKCGNLTSITFAKTTNWYIAEDENGTNQQVADVSTPQHNATKLKENGDWTNKYLLQGPVTSAEAIDEIKNASAGENLDLNVTIDSSSAIANISQALIENSSKLTGGVKLTINGDSTNNTITQDSFVSMPYITEVEISGITSIGAGAFAGCGITSLVLDEGLVEIGERAFSSCANITSITLPNSLKRIAPQAFMNCTSLQQLIFKSPANWYVNASGYGYTTLIEDIGNAQTAANYFNGTNSTYTTYYWSKKDVAQVTTMAQATTYLDQVYDAITNSQPIDDEVNISVAVLTSNDLATLAQKMYTISNSGSTKPQINLVMTDASTITEITSNGNALRYCGTLKSVVIPNSVIRIERYAFEGNTTSITFAVTSGWYATSDANYKDGDPIIVSNPQRNAEKFKSVSDWNLKYLYRGTVTSSDALSILQNSNSPSEISLTVSIDGTVTIANLTEALKDNTKKVDLVITDGITSLDASAFNSCTSLRSIELPDTITNLGSSNTFSMCQNLESIKLPNNSTIESIPYGMFMGCKKLTYIEIPNSITRIQNNAFNDCEALETIKMLGSTPPSFGTGVFASCPSTLKILVPTGSGSNYSQALSDAGYSSIAENNVEEY